MDTVKQRFLTRKLSTLLVGCILLWQAPTLVDTITGADVLGGTAHAARRGKKEEKRDTPALREATYKKLAEAQEMMDLKDNRGALVLLEELSAKRGLNEYELAQIYNLIASIQYQLENVRGAMRAYEKVLEGGDKIPVGLELATLYNLSQLNFIEENFRPALDFLERWYELAENPGASTYIYKAQIHYSLKDYRGAIPPIERAMAVAQERGDPIKEQWWLLLRVQHYELENWPKVLDILKILIRDFPKREYWIQLAGVYAQENQERKALNALQVAYYGNYFEKRSECSNLAGLLMQYDVPNTAANTLSDCIKRNIVDPTDKELVFLGQAHQVAGNVDSAIEVYEQAAKVAETGEIYSRLAQLYLEKEETAKCVSSSQSGLDRGGLRKTNQARLILGMCQFEEDDLKDALATFEQVAETATNEDDKQMVKSARQWISYVRNERSRRQKLASSL